MTLVFLDGELQSMSALGSFRCGSDDTWRDGRWTPTKGLPLVRFRQDDHRLIVRQHGSIPDVEPPVTVDYALRGELADDKEAANGTLGAQVVFGRGHDSMYCHGRVSFTASARS